MEIILGILTLMFLALQAQNEDTKKFHLKNCNSYHLSDVCTCGRTKSVNDHLSNGRRKMVLRK